MSTIIANNGCKLHDDCLTCPLPECIYITNERHTKTEQRYAEIRQLVGTSESIAKHLGISLKTVQRALKEQ